MGMPRSRGWWRRCSGASPATAFRRTGPIDAHNDRLRFGWELAPEGGGAPAVRGVDFAVVAPDGRLASVTGFFDA